MNKIKQQLIPSVNPQRTGGTVGVILGGAVTSILIKTGVIPAYIQSEVNLILITLIPLVGGLIGSIIGERFKK